MDLAIFMETIDLNRLLLREDQQKLQATLVNIADLSIDPTFLQDQMVALLDQRFSAILVSNKESRTAISDGHFMLELSEKGIQLLEQKSTQRLLYRFAFATKKITLNDRAVDSSFVHPFITKIKHISSLLQEGKANSYSKEIS